ncbi:MAG: hypothetical protein CML22_06950 [Rheinheimera sp.]|nr:hypothetical protein [Rheinheimera sp.]MBM34021.1 hypothetical protein [Rheinheimera sp.]
MVKEAYSGLKSITLHDSYGKFRGKTVSIQADGFTSIGGGNGVGKTSAISLIPIFYGQEPERMVSRSSGKYSFLDYYLPSSQSMIVFEYSNCHGMQCVVLSRGSDRVQYRFIEGAIGIHLSSPDGLAKLAAGATVSDVFAWLRSIQHPMSNLITVIRDYRAIVQRSRELLRGKENSKRLKEDAERYGLGDPNTDLSHLEKITTGVLHRSMLMESLKEVICDSLIKEQHLNDLKDEQRKNIKYVISNVRALQDFKHHLDTFQKCISDNQERLTFERQATEEVEKLHSAILTATDQTVRYHEQIQQLTEEIDTQRQKKSESFTDSQEQITLASNDIKRLNEALFKLDDQQTRYDEMRIDELSSDFENLSSIEQQLNDALSHMQRLEHAVAGKVHQRDDAIQSVNTKFADMERKVRKRLDELGSKKASLTAELHQKEIKQRGSQQVELEQLREDIQSEEAKKDKALALLRERMSNLTFTQQERDELDLARTKYDETNEKLSELRQDLRKLDDEKNEQQRKRLTIEDKHNHQALELKKIKDKRQTVIDMLNPKDGSLLCALRDHDPMWYQSLGKVINPELLTRKDLNPKRVQDLASSTTENNVYGWQFELSSVDIPMPARPSEELQAEVARLDHLVGSGEAQLSELNRQLAFYTNEIKRIDDARQQAKQSIHMAETEVTKAKSNLVYLEGAMKKALSERKSNLQSELHIAEKELSNLSQTNKARLSDMKESHSALLMELKALAQEQEAEIQSQIDAARTQLDEEDKLRRQRIKEISQAYEQSLAADGLDPVVIRTARQQHEQLEARIGRINSKKAEIFTYQNWRDSELPKRHSYEVKKSEKERLVSKLRDQQSQIRQEFERRINELQTQLTSLKTKRNDIKDAIEECKSSVKRAKDYGIEPIQERLGTGDLRVQANHLDGMLKRIHELRKAIVKAVSHASDIILTRHADSTLAEQYRNRINNCQIDDTYQKELIIASILEDFMKTDLPQYQEAIHESFRAQANILDNYYGSLNVLVAAVKSTSRKLHQILNTGQSIPDIQNIQIHLETKLEQSDSWGPLRNFSEMWQERQELQIAEISDEIIGAMNNVAINLEYIRVSGDIRSMIDMTISMEENQRKVKIRTTADFAGSSSNGLSYLCIIIIFKAITMHFCKGSAVSIAWPLDELGTIDSSNCSKLFNMLEKDNIYLITATPELSKAMMWAFKNTYSFEKGKVVQISDHAKGKNSLMAKLNHEPAVEVSHG